VHRVIEIWKCAALTLIAAAPVWLVLSLQQSRGVAVSVVGPVAVEGDIRSCVTTRGRFGPPESLEVRMSTRLFKY